MKSAIGGNTLNEALFEELEKKETKILCRHEFTKKLINGQMLITYPSIENTDPSYKEYMKKKIIMDLKHNTLSIKQDPLLER